MEQRCEAACAPDRDPAHSIGPSGARGEYLAAAALTAAGYRIVARNLRTQDAELDLLARRGRLWIAVEVKARADHPAPERHVTSNRLDRLERALHSLAPTLRPSPVTLRIDVVAVRWLDGGRAEILHFPGVRGVARDCHSTRPSRRHPARAADRTKSDRSPSQPIRLPMPTLAEQILPRRKLLLMFCETVLFTLVLLLGTSLWPLGTETFDLTKPSVELLRCLLSCFTIALICQASLSYNDLYDWRTAQNRAELANRLVHSAGYALVMMALLGVVAKSVFYFPGLPADGYETWKIILLIAIAFVAVYILRHALHWFFYKWRGGERILVLGSSSEAQQLARMVMDNPMAGYELVGIIEEPDQPPLPADHAAPVLGKVDCLRALCRKEGISRVVVALRERRGRVPVTNLLEARMDGVLIEEREAMFERLTGRLALESMKPSYLIYGRGFAKDRLTMVLKRVLDILASLTGLLLSLPICLIATVLIKLTSKGPVFFRQQRVGQDGEPFDVIKFRTMRTDAEKESGPVWAQKNDSRVTAVGKFLRLSRIDEIPQFLNILTGHMSFVGPRPERPHFVDQLKAEIPFYPLRHTVKPGLTGWAQVRHPYGASVEDAREKLRYDLYYIKNMSFLFDCNIILRTVNVILRGKGAR